MSRVLSSRYSIRARQFGFIALACAMITACGKQEENLEVVPVSGKVTVGGTPLPRGQVTFNPDESKGNTSTKVPSGTIQPDGSYTLTTGSKEGAPPGWYKVTVRASGMSDPNQANVKLPAMNPADMSPKTTRLLIEVKQGGGPYDLKMTKLQ